MIKLASSLFIAFAFAATSVGHMDLIATSEKQWTGIALEKNGGLFVNYPRWSDDVPVSVAHFRPDSDLMPFPDQTWNSWKQGEPPENKFVCVQSVVLDPSGNIWVLDPASPKMAGVVPGGAKLLSFDPKSGKLLRSIPFDATIAPEKSYLNDVRFTNDMKYAFITDSGMGAIVVVDLTNNTSRRLLTDDKSTKSEHTPVVINGKTWTRDGKQPDIQSDAIAIDAPNKYLYYKALTAETLYRIPVAALLDTNLDEKSIASKVEVVSKVGPTDGIEFGKDGFLYLTDLNHNAVTRWKPGMKAPTTYAKDARLVWPDSLSTGPSGKIYVSTSRINEGSKPSGAYEVYKIK